MKKIFSLVAVLALSSGVLVGETETFGFQGEKIGKLKPRLAKDIVGSSWTIGCEVLDRELAVFANYKDYLPSLGIKRIRLQGGWARCEKEKGKYDFSWIDEPVDFARKNGMTVLLETSYGNPIYEGAGGWDLGAGFPKSEEGLKAWDNWVEAMAKHFKGRVTDWAMWNEPDLRKGNNSPDAVAAFNIRSAKILKKHMPDCRLHGLSLAGSSPERLEEFIKPMGEDVKLFDTFIYHGYVPNPDLSYETDAARKAVIAKYAPHAKLRQGENGTASEFLATLALRYIPWSELSQAKYDLRRALGDLCHDVESGLFCIVDINYAPPTFEVPFCNRKGYLRLNSKNDIIQVKRAYYAIQNMVSVFNSDLTRIPEKKVSITDPSIALFEYQTRKGEPLFVFWEKGRMICKRREGGTRVEYDAVIDTESGRPSDSLTTREVIFEWGGRLLKDPVWVDLITGWVYEIPSENQIQHADGITFVRIPVYDSPCFVTERAALDLL